MAENKEVDPMEGLKELLKARAWFEGNPEGALDEIEHRVRAMLEAPDGESIWREQATTNEQRRWEQEQRALKAETLLSDADPYVTHTEMCATLVYSRNACDCGFESWLARRASLRMQDFGARPLQESAADGGAKPHS